MNMGRAKQKWWEVEDAPIYVDALTFGPDVRQIIEDLGASKVTAVQKFHYSDCLCNRVYLCMRGRLLEDARGAVVTALTPLVQTGRALHLPLRLRFLRYKDAVPAHQIAAHQFEVKPDMPRRGYYQILSFLLRDTLRTPLPVVEEVVAELQMHYDATTSTETKSEIADILCLAPRPQANAVGRAMLEELRLAGHVRRAHPPARTVYTDTQNVHDASINNNVKKVVHRLVELARGVEQTKRRFPAVIRDLSDSAPYARSAIQRVGERLEIDVATFEGVTLMECFCALWEYIEAHPQRADLRKRLVEEMVAMASFCATGHLARFANVVQGFTDDAALTFSLDPAARIKAILVYRLNAALQLEEHNDVMNALMDDDKTKFYEFVRDFVNKCLPEFRDAEPSVSGPQYADLARQYVTGATVAWYATDQGDIAFR
uniref:Uncharacterized protein n=1 Tax=Marseillevirus LCMAC103 TaxID=2506604 RepID=A0A481YW65_9VIRU|nr:MAG: hypothetical protein LCMAC103_01360 [Marseillevirus LCMAC103]